MEASQSIFQRLLRQRSEAGDRLRMRDTDVRTAGGRAAHAVDLDGRPVLLIPLAEEEEGAEDTTSRGVTLRERPLLDGDTTKRFLSLRCENPALDEPFGVLCDEVLSTLGSDAGRPASSCVRILERWRDLLGPRRQQLLGESAVLGLLVELRLLERLATEDPGAVRLWTGPDRARADFTGPAAVAEAKGTVGRERFTVEIHGLLQLEAPRDKGLYLWAEQMERVPVGGDGLPDVIARLRDLGVPAHELLSRLADTGYLAADADSYAAVRFAPLASRAVAIDDRFPRLVRSALADPGLADRITAVRYSVDLTDEAVLSGTVAVTDIVAALLADPES